MKGKKNGNNSWQILAIVVLLCICFALWIADNAASRFGVTNNFSNVSDEAKYEEKEGQKDIQQEEEKSRQEQEEPNINQEYHVGDDTKSTSEEEQVTIDDLEPPTISLYGNVDIWVDSLEDFIDQGFIANDDVDGDLTDKVKSQIITIEEGKNYEIEYTVEDSSHNVAKATRNLRIRTGLVYLTFDDGPSEEITPQILDILAAKNVKATFFVVGYNTGSDKEELIKREVTDGHTIGIHGYSHDYATIYKSIDDLMENFTRLQDLLEETLEETGEKFTFIRFPGGASNTISSKYCEGIMSEAVEEVGKHGFIYFDWNVDSDDAGSASNSSDDIYQNVIDGICPGRTNIVLMHDSATKQSTVDALERIIDYCEENNYELRAIDENTTLVQHPTFN